MTRSASCPGGFLAGLEPGGGIYTMGPLAVWRSLLFNNHASTGGGIRSLGGTLTVENCTFVGNAAEVGGACSFATSGLDAVFTHVTITGNRATFSYGGGGLYSYARSAKLQNCIIAGNSSPVGPDLRDDLPGRRYVRRQGSGWTKRSRHPGRRLL